MLASRRETIGFSDLKQMNKSMFLQVFGSFPICSDLLGPVRMHFGYLRMQPDAFGSIWTLSENFRRFVSNLLSFAIFARLLRRYATTDLTCSLFANIRSRFWYSQSYFGSRPGRVWCVSGCIWGRFGAGSQGLG